MNLFPLELGGDIRDEINRAITVVADTKDSRNEVELREPDASNCNTMNSPRVAFYYSAILSDYFLDLSRVI